MRPSTGPLPNLPPLAFTAWHAAPSYVELGEGSDIPFKFQHSTVADQLITNGYFFLRYEKGFFNDYFAHIGEGFQVSQPVTVTCRFLIFLTMEKGLCDLVCKYMV